MLELSDTDLKAHMIKMFHQGSMTIFETKEQYYLIIINYQKKFHSQAIINNVKYVCDLQHSLQILKVKDRIIKIIDKFSTVKWKKAENHFQL